MRNLIWLFYTFSSFFLLFNWIVFWSSNKLRANHYNRKWWHRYLEQIQLNIVVWPALLLLLAFLYSVTNLVWCLK